MVALFFVVLNATLTVALAAENPVTRHPVVDEFGISQDLPPTSLYLVRAPDPLPHIDGLTVHAQKRDCYLVSGPREAIEQLRTVASQVMPADLDTPSRPRSSRTWQRVTVPDPRIQAAVDRVSWEGLRPKIQVLQDYGTRLRCAPNHDAVRDSLAGFFENLGLDVTLQTFPSPVFWYCREFSWGDNVIATQPGILYPDSVVIICAHYDSWSENPVLEAPGADDNASGVAAVMTAAELLLNHRFAYTIQYICFGGEEYGPFGSGYYARRARPDGVNIVGALNFDMIGYWVEGVDFDLEVEANESSVWLADALLNAAELYTETPCDLHITDIGWSDNAAFWGQGYSALNNEEAWDFGDPDFNPTFHNSLDIIDFIHPRFIVANTRVAVAALATVARLSGTIRAVVDISPKTLNLDSEGRWITGRIELPVEYDPSQVDRSSIRLNEAVAPEVHSAAVRDADGNKTPDLTVKFPRAEVAGILGTGDSVQLRIAGLVGGECFEGYDTIRVIRDRGVSEVTRMDAATSNQFDLLQNFPNPFNPTTTISFSLLERTRATLTIYDVEGIVVTTLVDDTLDKGLREVTWDGRDSHGNPASSGVYFYRLTAGEQTLTKKMVLLR